MKAIASREERAKLLIVDDERLNLNLLNALLKSDYKIMVATNGEQALKGALSGKPDLILLDIVMPGMDGYEVCRQLKANLATQQIPIIFITALCDSEMETQGFELGAVDFISKPFSNSVVKARIATHMRLKRKSDLLEKLVSQDSLTEIPNRRALDEAREREWARCLRSGLPISFVMIDIDLFKQYNDHYGHGAGDECLARVAKALWSCAQRPGDFVGRYGGEEFAAILPETDREGAMQMGENFRASIAALNIPHAFSMAAPHVTVSIGVAAANAAATSVDQLLAGADKMLYQAKAGGRNQVQGCRLQAQQALIPFAAATPDDL